MPEYTITFYNVAHNDKAIQREIDFHKALEEGPLTKTGEEISTRTSFQATVSINAPDLWQALRTTGAHLRSKGIYSGFRSWSGWYSPDIIRCANRILQAKYTPAEIADPDSIMQVAVPTTTIVNSDGETDQVPALDAGEFIKTARKRHRMLVRYQLAIAFATANPTAGFNSPMGAPVGGGISVLKTDTGIVTFSAIRRRAHVKSYTTNVDEWIEPTDSHRYQAILAHEQQVISTNHGNMAIANHIATQPAVLTPEQTQAIAEWQAARLQVHDTIIAPARTIMDAAEEAMGNWLTAHPNPTPATEDDDIPF